MVVGDGEGEGNDTESGVSGRRSSGIDGATGCCCSSSCCCWWSRSFILVKRRCFSSFSSLIFCSNCSVFQVFGSVVDDTSSVAVVALVGGKEEIVDTASSSSSMDGCCSCSKAWASSW